MDLRLSPQNIFSRTYNFVFERRKLPCREFVYIVLGTHLRTLIDSVLESVVLGVH